MKQRFKHIQLVFCAHQLGKLAYENEIHIQPPLGIVSIASYLKKHIIDIEIEVIDGKRLSNEELFNKIDAEFLGFSVWYSNYENTIKCIKKIKQSKPWIKIAIGGPHVSFLADRIIKNNIEVDFVFKGEAEKTFFDFIKGLPLEKIDGLLYRDENCRIAHNIDVEINTDINEIPAPDLSLIFPSYEWLGNHNNHAMTAFPFSGIRGCSRTERCEYCSIPLTGYRVKDPECYWKEIYYLNEKWGVDYFFETGDVATYPYLKRLAEYRNDKNVSFRIYSYPGNLKIEHLPVLKKIGVVAIFMGIESSLIWNRKFNRKYNGYDFRYIQDTIKNFSQNGIKTIPSFILGLEGECLESFDSSVNMIQKLNSIEGIDEITVSKIIPLPGTKYFRMCLESERIKNQYEILTKTSLLISDTINFEVLSLLFIDEFTNLKSDDVNKYYKDIVRSLGAGVASWL
jgi:anaerobic magnesium-protoporphyrin IX monomethyl ester cyclase